jgi:hypothetical protein
LGDFVHRQHDDHAGFFGDALRKASKFTPTGIAIEGGKKLKQLLNRNAACNCDNNIGPIRRDVTNSIQRMTSRRLNGVGPGSYSELSAMDVLGYN